MLAQNEYKKGCLVTVDRRDGRIYIEFGHNTEAGNYLADSKTEVVA